MSDSKPELPLHTFEGRLRAICRSSAEVNALRAEFSGSIKVADSELMPKLDLAVQRRTFTPEQSKKKKQKFIDSLKKGKGKVNAVENEIEIEAFGFLTDENAVFSDETLTARRGRFVTLRGTPRQLDNAGKEASLMYVKLANTVSRPQPVTESVSRAAAPPAAFTLPDDVTALAGGDGVLVGIIDVGGFDFAHPDFVREDGTTRFDAIWDQGDDTFAAPAKYAYGSMLTKAHLAYAMKNAKAKGLTPTELMPQSQMTRGSHATHVASIAAGNRSIASKAMIAGVLISLPEADQDRRLSFYDTTRIVHAVDFLFDLAEELGAKGVSINISLGTNGGAHDDSSPMSSWIDYGLTQPGRSVSVAAGNAGQEAPQNSRDIGFMLGRIHTAGHIGASGLVRHLEWVVVGDGVEDISENELEIWYEPQDRISVQLRPPGEPWMTVVDPGQYMQNIKLRDGTYVSIYNELYDTGNGCNRISIYLSPLMSKEAVVGVTPGTWRVKLIGSEIRDGRFHGWIERDDPIGVGGAARFWRFPSFFSTESNVDDSSISTLACGSRIIGVANYDTETLRINVTSSQGPTRDGRSKPDIAAPGTRIWAANGFDHETLWVAKSGTSMASPHVAGLTAAMLALAPSLTASQILGVIRRTSSPLPGRLYAWQNDAGFGAVDFAKCLTEAAAVGEMKEVS